MVMWRMAAGMIMAVGTSTAGSLVAEKSVMGRQQVRDDGGGNITGNLGSDTSAATSGVIWRRQPWAATRRQDQGQHRNTYLIRFKYDGEGGLFRGHIIVVF